MTSPCWATTSTLTDPDSNEDVPPSGPRFANDFMLTSQGDKEQIFYASGSKLAVLRLSQSVDDTAWARSPHGLLVGANTGGDTIDMVTGPFPAESIFVAVTPCDADNAPATCLAFGPQGMVFIGPGWNVMPG
jgi:hypothetical protein